MPWGNETRNPKNWTRVPHTTPFRASYLYMARRHRWKGVRSMGRTCGAVDSIGGGGYLGSTPPPWPRWLLARKRPSTERKVFGLKIGAPEDGMGFPYDPGETRVSPSLPTQERPHEGGGHRTPQRTCPHLIGNHHQKRCVCGETIPPSVLSKLGKFLRASWVRRGSTLGGFR